MELAWIIFQQEVILIAMAMIGFMMLKRGLLSQETLAQLNTVVVKYLTPLVILEAFFKPFELNQVIQFVLTIGVYTAFLFLRIIVGNWYYGRYQNGVSKFATVFGNVGFIGIPLTLAVFDPSFLIITTGLLLVNNFLCWTYGLEMVSVRDMQPKIRFSAKPIWIVFAIGILIQALQLPIPAVISKGIHQLNQVYTPLAMIILGSYFIEITDIKDYKDRQLWQTAAIKMLGWPLINIALLLLIPALTFESFFILVMILSSPCAMMTSLLSRMMGGNYLYGAKLILITTLASLVTVPSLLNLAVWAYQHLYPYN